MSYVVCLNVWNKYIYLSYVLQLYGTSPVSWTAVPNSLNPFSVVWELEEKFDFLIHRQSFIFLLFRSLPHLFYYLYTVSLSFITIFLKNCLASQPTSAYLFFMRKLDQEEHCSCWGEGCEARCVHQTFVKHFTSFAFTSSLGVFVVMFTSILLHALHHLNSF